MKTAAIAIGILLGLVALGSVVGTVPPPGEQLKGAQAKQPLFKNKVPEDREKDKEERFAKAIELVKRSLQASLDGKLADAILDAEEAVKIDPKCAEAWHALGVSKIRLATLRRPTDILEYRSGLLDLGKAAKLNGKYKETYDQTKRSFDKLVILTGG